MKNKNTKNFEILKYLIALLIMIFFFNSAFAGSYDKEFQFKKGQSITLPSKYLAKNFSLKVTLAWVGVKDQRVRFTVVANDSKRKEIINQYMQINPTTNYPKKKIFYFGENGILTIELLEVKKGLTYKYARFSLKYDQIPSTNCDVVVVGGGTGGIAAGLQSARLGAKTCILEETTWLGGMYTAAAVSGFDGNPDLRYKNHTHAFTTGIFGEIVKGIRAKYDGKNNPGNCWVSWMCFEPHVGNQVLKEMATKEKNLYIYYNHEVTDVIKSGTLIKGVIAKDKSGKQKVFLGHVTIDATEYGDVMNLASIPFSLGRESKNTTGEKYAHHEDDDCLNPFTYAMVIRDYGYDRTMGSAPKGYNKKNYEGMISGFGWERFITYLKISNNPLKSVINWPKNGNDIYDVDIVSMSKSDRKKVLEDAKNYSLGLLYYIQTELGKNTWDLDEEEFPTKDHFPLIPYIRESRRLVGVERMKAEDIAAYANPSGRGTHFKNSIAIGDYSVDIHKCRVYEDSFGVTSVPFQVPYGILVPQKFDGFLAAEKNISVTHLANGSTRLQPIVTLIGQAAGAAAALSAKKKIQPRYLKVREIQEKLLESGDALYYFSDVYSTTPYFKEIQIMALDGIMGDYRSGYKFSPYTRINENEFSQILEKAFGENHPKATDLMKGSTVTRAEAAKLVYDALQKEWKLPEKPEKPSEEELLKKEKESLLKLYDAAPKCKKPYRNNHCLDTEMIQKLKKYFPESFNTLGDLKHDWTTVNKCCPGTLKCFVSKNQKQDRISKGYVNGDCVEPIAVIKQASYESRMLRIREFRDYAALRGFYEQKLRQGEIDKWVELYSYGEKGKLKRGERIDLSKAGIQIKENGIFLENLSANYKYKIILNPVYDDGTGGKFGKLVHGQLREIIFYWTTTE